MISALIRRYKTVGTINLVMFRRISLHSMTLANNFFDIFKGGSLKQLNR